MHRNFDLGALNRTESGDTRGWHLMGSVLGGYWFNYATVLHGPFVRLAYQDIRVKGYAERGNDSTALVYGEQQRKSFISTLGWQVAGQRRQRAAVRARRLGARKQGRRSLRVGVVGHARRQLFDPTLKPDSNYVQYLLGASADFGRVTGYLAGPATSGRSDGNGYGVTLGMRVPL